MRHNGLQVLEVLQRSSQKSKSTDASEHFNFEVEERLQCGSSGAVRYIKRMEKHLGLPIDVLDAVNKDDVAAYVHAFVSLCTQGCDLS